MSDLGLVERVEKGFSPNTAKVIVRRVDPKGQFLQLAHIIPRSTYHVQLLRHYHEDSKLAAHFLLREHPMLGGRTPIDVAKDSTAGADLVLKLLAQAEAGIAV